MGLRYYQQPIFSSCLCVCGKLGQVNSLNKNWIRCLFSRLSNFSSSSFCYWPLFVEFLPIIDTRNPSLYVWIFFFFDSRCLDRFDFSFLLPSKLLISCLLFIFLFDILIQFPLPHFCVCVCALPGIGLSHYSFSFMPFSDRSLASLTLLWLVFLPTNFFFFFLSLSLSCIFSAIS